jgi:hypothetical protein
MISRLILLAVLASAGCVGPSDGWLGPVRDTPFLLYEREELQRLYGAQIHYAEWQAMSELFLVEKPPQDEEAELNRIARTAKPWRRNSLLASLTQWLTSDIPFDRTRWIIGTHPTVVAISAEADAPEQKAIPRIRYVTAEEASNIVVDRVVVQDKWIEFELAGKMESDSPPPASRRVVQLETPMTLEAVLESKRWVEAGKR